MSANPSTVSPVHAQTWFDPDTRRIVRLGVAVLAGSLGLFTVWAATAPLDEGVVAPGVVQTEGKRKPIQHPATVVITQVFVKEGQIVKAGAPLVQLDDSQVSAAYLTAQAQFLALKATEARLVAEATAAPSIRFDPILDAPDHAAAAQSYKLNEQRLLAARQASLSGDLSVLQQAVKSAMEQEKALQAQLEGRKAQQTLVSEQIKASRDLAKEGFISRTKLLDEERVNADLGAQINEILANLERARGNVTELRLRIAQRQREYTREVDSLTTQTRRDLAFAQERLNASRAELKRTSLTAPVDGMVVGLMTQAPGAVVPEGARIMDIVPQNEALVIEAQIAPEVVDRVRPGLPADVRFTGFPDLPYLAIEGTVVSISADRIEEGANRPPHFLARVAISPEGLKQLGTKRIQPGMSVEVVIKTGERTLLAYLMKPLTRRVSASLTEH